MTISVPTGDFQVPVDIGNRALQHIGVRRINTFADQAKGASELSFAYDKLRKAELRRNVWVFSTRWCALRPIDPTVLQLVPAVWSNTATYIVGSVVSFNNHIYIALADAVAATEPDQNPSIWSLYYGPMTATLWTNTGNVMGLQLWASSVTYGAGAQVIGSDGNEYQSLVNNNTGNNPTSSPGQWSLLGLAPTQGLGYYSGEIVYTPQAASPGIYLSTINFNANVPGVVPAWSSATVYNKDDVVTFSAATWQSTEDINLNNTPGVSGWIAIPGTQATQQSGTGWLKLNATLQSIRLVYPLGAGPSTQHTTENVFMLPNGYLRHAPEDPKAGAQTLWGSPTGRSYRDWVFGDDFFTSRETGPILFRFVADITTVTSMDPMFCEGFACRLALELCEPLTQSETKLGSISRQYEKFMSEARKVNAIEQGALEDAEDDYIVCRF